MSARWLVLLLAVWLPSCVEHATVGKNEVYCVSGEDCPTEFPLCETELSVCRQCFVDDDCGGADPDCDGSICQCETTEDCHEGLTCVDGQCDLD